MTLRKVSSVNQKGFISGYHILYGLILQIVQTSFTVILLRKVKVFGIGLRENLIPNLEIVYKVYDLGAPALLNPSGQS